MCEPEIWSARRAPVPTIREPHSALRALSRGVRLVCPFRISSSVPPCRTFALSSAPCRLGSDKSGARDSTLAAWSSGLDLSYRPTIPIVFTVVSDPVGTGFVKSWGRPGGNVTGLANFEPSIAGKWLELLKAVAPKVTRVAILFNPETAPARGSCFTNPLDRTAPPLGIELVQAPVQHDSGVEDVGAKLVREPGGGIIATPDVFTLARREQIVAMAARYGLPGAYPYSYFSKIGGLISYGADTLDLHRRAASYVDRILRGTKPADLPVQQPIKFELVINLKTARALGLEIPPTLLASADEIIE